MASYLPVIILITQVHAIDYSHRNDAVPSLESIATKTPPLENLLHGLLNLPASSSQQETERLLEYAGLVRLELLSKLGSKVYNDEELSLEELTALNDVYQRTLERKYDLLSILPLENMTLHHFCSLLGSTCETPSKVPLNFPTPPLHQNLSLQSLLDDLKSHQLELSSHLLLGLLLHVPFNSYDARVHNSLHHVAYSLLKDPDQKIESGLEHKTYKEMVDLVRDVLTSISTPHAQFLAEQLEQVIPLNSNIEALSAILDNDKINLKFLFDAVLPNDTLDKDLIQAKNYLRHHLERVKPWDYNELVGAEKYEYLTQDQLLIGLLDKLIDLDYIKDIASALKVDAYFWHKSHMIENLNDLLDLFDNYNNLRGIASYRELMKTISRIKDNLINSKNVTIELMCTRPRVCLKQGLMKVKKCRGINHETKILINNFFEQSQDCSECPACGVKEESQEKESDCDSEECEDDEVKASLSDSLEKLKKKRMEMEEREDSSTESLGTTEDSLAVISEETTEHMTTRHLTTEATEATTEATKPTTEQITEHPTTEAITERLTTEAVTLHPTTETTTERILETTHEITEAPTVPTEKIEWVEVPLKEITVSEDLHQEATTVQPLRTTLKMMPHEVHVEIATERPKKKRVVCHHRDLYHRKKLKKLNKYKKKHESSVGADLHHQEHEKIHDAGHSDAGHHIHVGNKHSGHLELEDSHSHHQHEAEPHLDHQHEAEPHADHQDEAEPHEDHQHEAEPHEDHQHEAEPHADHQHEHSGGSNLDDQHHEDAKSHDKHTDDSNSGHVHVQVGTPSHSKGSAAHDDDTKVDVHLHSHSDELHAQSDSAKLDAEAQSHSGEVHSDSDTSKVALHSHSDSGHLDLHSHSNSSELGVHSHGDSSKLNLQSASNSGESSSSVESEHTSGHSSLEKIYGLAKDGTHKLASGINKFNPFRRKNKNSHMNSNTNVNTNTKLNSRRSSLGSNVVVSSEEGSSSSEGSGEEFAGLKGHNHNHKHHDHNHKSHSHKKMTSYYNEEFQEEKHRSSHKEHHHHHHSHSGRRESDSKEAGNRMMDLNINKFLNLEFKRDEYNRTETRKNLGRVRRGVRLSQRAGDW